MNIELVCNFAKQCQTVFFLIKSLELDYLMNPL